MSSADVAVTNRCPVCQVRFRGVCLCSRCGADLQPLMLLAAQAWRMREAARRALESGEFERAHVLVSAAQQLHGTPTGVFLRALSAWLKRESSGL